jgi:hypothetical protein
VPEGHGFHCSINWQDQSRLGRSYVLFSFITIYFIPLMILFSVNIRTHQILRSTYATQRSLHSCKLSIDRINSKSSHRRQRYCDQIYYDRSKHTSCYIRQAADRKLFKIQYRFIQAIIVLVSTYIIAWTPYSIVAVLQLFHLKFVFHYAFLITISAFTAKLAVILAPLIYLSIMHFRLFKKILG